MSGLFDSADVEKFALGGGHGAYRGAIHVGLVNNMPDTAMRATELQFARLLKEAAGSLDVQLHLFSLAAIARGDVARSRMEGFYADAATLPMAGIDALIITGAEPRAANLADENYWPSLAQLIDWAQIGTVSAMFSCLAAHAAVQHISGIERAPLPRKLSGIFTAARMGDDPLQTGMQSRIHVPHSRRNGIPEGELVRHGYRILTRLDEGVDSFTRIMPGHSQFLFLQGHPEYGAESLGREYLRDMGRFLRGEIERPYVPENYFDRATENALAELDMQTKGPEDLSRYNAVVMGALPLHSWRGHTLKLFGNWLASIATEKLRRRAQPPVRRKLRA
jgi:homoserine O-succinyltransferase